MTVKRTTLRHAAWLALPIALPVIAAALLFALAISTYPQVPIYGDPVSYHMTAQRLLQRGVYAYSPNPPTMDTAPNADVTPGSALFLAGIYSASGLRSGDPTSTAAAAQPIVSRVQFVLALCVVGLVAGCGLTLGGRRLALLSGFMAALYLPFAWATSVALGESLAAFLAALQMLLALLLADTKSRRGFAILFAFGVVSAMLVMIRPVMIVWIPVPVIYLAIRRVESPKRLLVITGIILAGVLLVMVPWWVRNAVALRRFVPLAENSGRVTYLNTGGGELSPDERFVYDKTVAAGGDGWAVVARDRILQSLREAPIEFLSQRAERTWISITVPWSAEADILWSLRNTPNVIHIGGEFSSGWQPSSAMFQSSDFTGVYHNLLLLLAAGALLLIRRSPRLGIVASVPIYVILVYSVTLFINRYFFPAMPAVILLAATTTYWAANRLWRVLRTAS